MDNEFLKFNKMFEKLAWFFAGMALMKWEADIIIFSIVWIIVARIMVKYWDKINNEEDELD